MLKKITKFALGTLLATNVICSSAVNAADDNKVSIWAGESTLKVVEFAAEKYNEAKGEEAVVLEKTNIGAPDIYQKITTGLQAGGTGLPDLMLVEDSVMPDYLNNFSDNFLDLNELGFDEIKDLFASYKVDAISKEGHTYGFPFDSGPAAVFYRIDYFEEAGVSPADIKIWEDYVVAAKKVEEATGKKMLAFSYNGEDWVYRILMNQLGTFYVDNDGNAALNSPESERTLNLLLQLKEHAVNINNFSEGVAAVVNEEVATIVSGVWYSGTLLSQAPDQAGKWSAFPLPAFEEGGNQAANLGGAGFLVSKGANNPELVYDFMKFFSTNEEVQEYAFTESGLFPSLLSVQESDVMKEQGDYFTENIWNIFLEELNSIPPINYSYYAIATDMAQNMKGKVLNGGDVKQAMEEAQKQLEARMAN